jgi:hypothetical protein
MEKEEELNYLKSYNSPADKTYTSKLSSKPRKKLG